MSKKHVSYQAVGSALADVSNNEIVEELSAAIMQMQQDINDLQIAALACPFKVGMILCLDDSTDLNTVYPGTTWEKIEGRFLLGSSSSYGLGTTGGAATVTLTTDNMPSHYHAMNNHTHSVGAHSHGLNNHTHSMNHTHQQRGFKNSGREASGYGLSTIQAFTDRVLIDTGLTNDAETISGKPTTAGASSTTTGGASGSTANSSAFNSGGPSNNATTNTGGGGAHNNMPPYLVVNMWKRVA